MQNLRIRKSWSCVHSLRQWVFFRAIWPLHLGTLRKLHTKHWFALSSSMQHLFGIPIMNLSSGGSRGGSGGSLEPPLRPNYFIFMGIYLKSWVKLTKRTPLCKFEPPSRNPGSAPAQIGQVEKVQRTAARWTCRRWRNTSSVGDMLDDLEWPSLETRREQSSLTFFYKIHSGTVSLDKDKVSDPGSKLKKNKGITQITVH